MSTAEELSERRLSRDDRALAVEPYRDGDGTTVLQLYGEFDLASAPTFEAELARAEADDGPIVIDLSALEFIDSSGLSQLLAAHTRAEDDDRKLVFLKGPLSVERILRITGLDQILRFED
jgi:anti-sigma B factor antagonist